MKRSLIIIASLLFGILFYDKQIGLNLSIFSLLTILILAFLNREKIREKPILLFNAVYLGSAIMVFMHHSTLAVITNCFAFFTLIGSYSNSKSSIYIQWFNGIYTSIAGIFHRNFEVHEKDEKVTLKDDIDVWHWIKLIGIPVAVVSIFILLYKNGNPMFNDLVNKINFEFVNIQWILFCVLGYVLFTNISKPIAIETVTTSDLNTSNSLFKADSYSEEKSNKELQLGTLLIGLLNGLIVFYIITDILFLLSSDVQSAPELSSQVHNGINTLIASIIAAIAIILYFFRGDLNFYFKNNILKNLTYLWILLNVVLVVLIAIKNHNYISSYGLTYKRIGVYIYITLTLFGLITTFLKVSRIKNLVFLLRVNTQIAFAILIALCTVNWDKTITNYNLYKAQDFDIDYLIKLSDRNAFTLYQAKDQLPISTNNKARIVQKYNNYLRDLKSIDWQEIHWEYFKVINKQ